ncbi:MAG: hypothetical protein M3082_06260 [Candidatus Dormibacteraeota bacterium]|nr:hypothetical protein [Candidatus Dormibacteraeota bacterium]
MDLDWSARAVPLVRLHPSPQIPKGHRKPRRLDAVRCIEVIAVLEYVEREVREDAGETLRHPRIEVEIAREA